MASICVVTGATSGIGRETALGLAQRGMHVVAIGRNQELGERLVQDVRAAVPSAQIDLLLADLSRQVRVRELAATIAKNYPRVDVLVNNAGIIERHRILSPDGVEMTFALNHLAPFLLTNLLAPQLRASEAARVVNVSSVAHRRVSNVEDWQSERGRFVSFRAYSRSKLANVLFSNELARRTKGTTITSNALHPGGVSTKIGDVGGVTGFVWGLLKRSMISPKDGAQTSLYVATDPALDGVTGGYFDKSAPAPVNPLANDVELAGRLWDLSSKIVSLKGEGF